MSTDPTSVTQATEAVVDIESIKQIMDGFDPAALLPELDVLFGNLAAICRVAVLVGPIVLIVLGLAYLFLSPKEANYYFGYRCYYGMGSVQAWQFTQRLAGTVLALTGLILTILMIFLSSGFAGMEMMDMVWKAVACLLWEAGLALIATLAINTTAMVIFDRRGDYRKNKRK